MRGMGPRAADAELHRRVRALCGLYGPDVVAAALGVDDVEAWGFMRWLGNLERRATAERENPACSVSTQVHGGGSGLQMGPACQKSFAVTGVLRDLVQDTDEVLEALDRGRGLVV